MSDRQRSDAAQAAMIAAKAAIQTAHISAEGATSAARIAAAASLRTARLAGIIALAVACISGTCVLAGVGVVHYDAAQTAGGDKSKKGDTDRVRMKREALYRQIVSTMSPFLTNEITSGRDEPLPAAKARLLAAAAADADSLDTQVAVYGSAEAIDTYRYFLELVERTSHWNAEPTIRGLVREELVVVHYEFTTTMRTELGFS